MITVFEVIGELEVGGAESQLVHIATRLDPLRFRPIVVSLTPDGAFARPLRDAGIEVIGLRRRGHFDPSRVGAVVRLIRARRPGVVHGHQFSANAYSGLACRLTGAPHVVSALTSELPPAGFRRGVDGILCRGADAVLTNSRAMQAKLLETHRLPRERVHLIYNGLPDEFFAVDRAARDVTRRDLGAAPGDTLALLVATLSPEKDHAFFLRALAAAARGGAPVRAALVGGGREERALRRLASELGIEDRVAFCGTRSDVRPYLAAADVFVNSSRREGVSNAIVEAMAAALPVIATSVGGNVDLVRDGETGLLVGPGDVAALAGALRRLGASAEERSRLGGAARDLVRGLCSMDGMVRRVSDVYERAAGGAR
jgi:glycosyltransferase involved in cell wall biosynthesis